MVGNFGCRCNPSHSDADCSRLRRLNIQYLPNFIDKRYYNLVLQKAG